VTLKGVDGSVWNLNDRSSPARLIGGLGGLHLPHVKHQWTQTARGYGRRHNGSVTDARSFTVNIALGDPEPPFRTGPDWMTLDAQFWQALDTETLAELVVGDADPRSLFFRLDEDTGFDFPQDPALRGIAHYPILCIADNPAWTGPSSTTVYPFQPDDETNYYGGQSGFGPPFFIVEPSLFSAATAFNAGDLPTWPIWRITGPCGAFRVGVGERVIQPPFALQQGDVVIIDTEAQTITDPQGNDLWPLMGYAPVDFAPLASAGDVPIAIGMDSPGTGAQIAITVTPKFRRAWGVQPYIAPPPGGGGGGGGGGSAGLGLQPLGTSPLGGA
jgi:hypothetical protein